MVMSSAEDPLPQVVVPRLHAADAVLDRIKFVAINRDGFQMPPLLPADLATVRERMEQVQARLLVFDPLMAHLGAQVNSWKDQEIRAALSPLQRLAEETGAAVVVVAHLNKGQSSDPLQRLGGSIGLPAAARSVLLLARDPDDPDEQYVVTGPYCWTILKSQIISDNSDGHGAKRLCHATPSSGPERPRRTML